MDVDENMKMIKEEDIRKAVGPIGVRDIKEYADLLTRPIHDIIKSSINEGDIQEDQKRTNMMIKWTVLTWT